MLYTVASAIIILKVIPNKCVKLGKKTIIEQSGKIFAVLYIVLLHNM